MNDVVYMLLEDLPLDGVELRYSLRSLRNLPHKDVWMVTPKLPEWVTNVHHLPWKQKKVKFRDLNDKWHTLIHYDNPDLTDDVYIVDDDNYVMEEVEEFGPFWPQVPLTTFLRYRPPLDGYAIAQRNTLNLLRSEGIEEPKHINLHHPFHIKRSEFDTSFYQPNKGGPYEFKTIWANRRIQQGEKGKYMIGDFKVTDAKSLAWNRKEELKFLSSAEEAFHVVRSFLEDAFPEKSEYEL